MKKNYKKMYNKLVKEIKRLKKEEKNYIPDGSDKFINAFEKRLSEYAVTCLNVVLEMEEEISGKKWNNNIMNQTEFEAWKGKIKK